MVSPFYAVKEDSKLCFYLPKNHFSNERNDKLIRNKNRFIWSLSKNEHLYSNGCRRRDSGVLQKSGDDFEKKSLLVSFRLFYFISL